MLCGILLVLAAALSPAPHEAGHGGDTVPTEAPVYAPDPQPDPEPVPELAPLRPERPTPAQRAIPGLF